MVGCYGTLVASMSASTPKPTLVGHFEGSTTFEAYLDGILVETLIAATTNDAPLDSGKYYGFENILLDEIRFTVTSPFGPGFTLDNLQYNVIPSQPPYPCSPEPLQAWAS